MRHSSRSILLLCFFLELTLLQLHASAAYLNATCSPTDTYTIGSSYEQHLIDLLKKLNANATANGGFSALSVGNSSDKAYGLIMCYADYSMNFCQACLNDATSIAQKICPGSATATFYYDECLLRYSSKDFRSQVAHIKDQWCISNPNSPLDIGSKYFITNLISNVSLETPESPQMTANREIQTYERTISALVQCTRDLSQDGCKQCIQGAMVNKKGFPACSRNLTCIGMRLMLGSCYIRYEMYLLNITTFPPAAAPAVSPAAGPAISPPNDPAGRINTRPGPKSNSTMAIVVSTVVASVVAAIAAFVLCLWRIRRGKTNDEDYQQETVETELKYILRPIAEYQVFHLTILKIATDDFSNSNKLGRGGFGSVYKGILPDGQLIAVKRLSECSVQGVTEFKNEVDSLAKLKHKNLVQLVGCCITNQEKLLCYEYLPHGSLDKILFARDTSRRTELCWNMRYKIIDGICNGLHYLHEESRLRIIHRDLKVGNILLDKDMNPKIADFGLARFFDEDETHKDTSIVAGTFGYMAPEYINCGSFSAKSDVYSFGVLLLEILTGQKCSSVVGSDRISTLRDNALVHWNNGTISQLMDPVLEEDCIDEIKRCAHIALLCVQDDPNNRPNMAAIRFMLGGPSTLPDLPSTWSPPERLQFPILDETSATRFHPVNSQTERSKGTTSESEDSLPMSIADGSTRRIV